MTIEIQHSYARYGKTTLCKREHNTETGAVTEYVDCTPEEQKAFEDAHRAKREKILAERESASVKKPGKPKK